MPPGAWSTRTTTAPRAAIWRARSLLFPFDMTATKGCPRAAHTMARPVPVLPLVSSTTSWPGRSRPSAAPGGRSPERSGPSGSTPDSDTPAWPESAPGALDDGRPDEVPRAACSQWPPESSPPAQERESRAPDRKECPRSAIGDPRRAGPWSSPAVAVSRIPGSGHGLTNRRCALEQLHDLDGLTPQSAHKLYRKTWKTSLVVAATRAQRKAPVQWWCFWSAWQAMSITTEEARMRRSSSPSAISTP